MLFNKFSWITDVRAQSFHHINCWHKDAHLTSWWTIGHFNCKMHPHHALIWTRGYCAEIFSRSVFVRWAWVRANAYSNELGAALLGILSLTRLIYAHGLKYGEHGRIRPTMLSHTARAIILQLKPMSKRACISVLPSREGCLCWGRVIAPPVQKRGSG